MNREGQLEIMNDNDGDGINDNVKRLSYDVSILFAKKLSTRKQATTFIQIGSLSDKYRIDIHGSWVKSMDLLKNDLENICSENERFNALVLNVSSVLTPKELIDRPFVSVNTNADMRYWLPPVEIVYFIDNYIQSPESGFIEKDLYKKWPNISPNHFTLELYKERRGREMYDTLAYEYKDILNLSNGDSVSYSFTNPFHMDRLWGNLTILLARHHEKDQPIFFYNPHSWFFLIRNKTEHEIFLSIERYGGTVLLTCGNDTKIDRETLEKEFKNYNHSFTISADSNFENNFNLNMYGDFIIEVLFDKETANRIDEFYHKYDEINQENIFELKEIVSRNGENKLTVYKNRYKATSLRNILERNFTDN